jgi:hypothetical protein
MIQQGPDRARNLTGERDQYVLTGCLCSMVRIQSETFKPRLASLIDGGRTNDQERP